MNLLLFILPLLEVVNSSTQIENFSPAKPESIVEGIITDSVSNQPLAFAYVVLNTTAEGKLTYNAITDDQGKFVFNGVKKGKYKIQVSLMGYKQPAVPELEVTENSLMKLNPISIAPAATVLEGTEIVAQKPYIKTEAGKMILDVEKSDINQTGTALEVLQNTPTVSVSQTGDVSVKGRQGVRFLIDGKPAPASQTDPESFLRSIPAGSIAQIEVITNPGAKYDAEGSAAIINIKLKKSIKLGFNGKVNAGVGTPFNKFNGGLNVNYRDKNLNAFANYSFNDNRMNNRWEEKRKVEEGNSFYSIHNINKGRDRRSGHNVKAGIDWYVKPEHTLSLTSTFNHGIGGGPWNTENSISNDLGVLQTVSKSQANYVGKKIEFTNTLSYQYQQDSGKLKWTADVLHTHLQRTGVNESNYILYDAIGNPLAGANGGTKNNSITTVDNITALTDGEIQFGNQAGTLSLGLKNETNLSRNNNETLRTANGITNRDTLASYLFRYYENIAAGYFTYGNRFGLFSFNIGCRAEHTYVASQLSGVSQNYISFFPDATLTFDLKKQNTLSFSYGRRIGRPSFYQLNNFFTPYDQYTLEEGNPLLRPQFTNTVIAEYSRQFKQNSLYTNFNFNHTAGLMEQISYLDNNSVMRQKWINAGTFSNINLELGGNFQPVKWWSMSVNLGIRQMFFNVQVADTFINKTAFVSDLWMSHNFKMPWKLQLQLQGNVNSGWPGAQSTSQPMGQLDITLKRSFLKDNLTVALSCRDVTNTNFWKGETVAPTFTSNGFWKPESRIGYLTISYSFGGKETAPARRNIENQRLSGGGGRG